MFTGSYDRSIRDGGGLGLQSASVETIVDLCKTVSRVQRCSAVILLIAYAFCVRNVFDCEVKQANNLVQHFSLIVIST